MAAEDDDTTSRIVSVFAGCNRRNRWWLAPSTSLVSLFARSYLDLRDVVTDPRAQVIDMTVLCAIGSVTVVVPEGTDVTLSGTSLLASSTSLVNQGTGESALPRIVITATTVLGRMRVQTTPDAKKARRRRTGRVQPLTFADDAGPVDEIGANARRDEPAGTATAADEPAPVSSPDATVESDGGGTAPSRGFSGLPDPFEGARGFSGPRPGGATGDDDAAAPAATGDADAARASSTVAG